MKVGCIIYFYGKRYKEIGKIAVESFKAFHPEVDMIHVNKENAHLYESTKLLDNKVVNFGAYKHLLAAELMKKKGYDKMIVLGADTITCSRLDEFLDNNDKDLLVTLDYPYQLKTTTGFSSPDSETHLNSDVVCYNSIRPILDVIKNTKKYPVYVDQGALNEIVWSPEYDYTYDIVDGPYKDSNVVYNARAKGNICAGPGEKPWGPYTNKFYVDDKKLFTGDGKQIKVWHYCEGFGAISDTEFVSLINNWISHWFNKETKEFFKQYCKSGDFFEKEFCLE